MQVGDLFDGRYVIEKVLGQGGMGRVYLARNMNTDTPWAIKEICKSEVSGIELPAEPKLLKKLEHPALPRLYDILEQDGRLYMISDYIDGISLDKKLEMEGKIEEEIVVGWALQLCSALEYLHSLQPNPIVYRDMKPSNIILARNGALKLIDFGIAREYKNQSDGDTVYIGTRGYAAPEQYGTGQTSAVSDIYSLGVTLHHLLTGQKPTGLPFDIKPIRYFDESLSREMEEIILKCTRVETVERYHSVAELKKELERLQTVYQRGSVQQFPDGCGGISSVPGTRKNKGSGYPITGFPSHFRKWVITVWDNAEFGCELACMAAKYTGGEVLLADLDLLAPKADLFLSLGKSSPKSVQSGIYGHSGLDMVMDALGKSALTTEVLRGAVRTVKSLKNLYVLTGNDRLENYEYYSEDSVPKLIDKCYRSFDITILLVNRSIYDAFTLAALLKSDMNMVAIRGDVDQLREFNTYIEFLYEKQKLPTSRTKFILFEYDRRTQLSLSEAAEATRNNVLGSISFSRRRLLYRNLKGAYAGRMEQVIAQEYIRLLAKLEMVPSVGTVQRIGQWLGQLFRCSGHTQPGETAFSQKVLEEQ